MSDNQNSDEPTSNSVDDQTESDGSETDGAANEGIGATDGSIGGLFGSGADETDSPSSPDLDGSEGPSIDGNAIRRESDEEGLDAEDAGASADAADQHSGTKAGGWGLQRETDDDRELTSREKPERSDPTEQGAFSVPNYAQDLVDVELVFEQDDDLLPQGVDGSGLVVIDEKRYVGLLTVRPRSWSIHTGEKKAEIVSTFQSAVLAPLEFPVQIVSYPTNFDISDHVSKLEEAIENERSDDSKLIRMGRRLYPNWMTGFIEENDMKQRRFYVVVPISADKISQFENKNTGLAETIEERFPPLSPLVGRFTETDDEDVTRRQCIRELNARLGRIQSGLQRLDVRAERLRDRQEALSVLYHYYNNERPAREFETGPYTVFDEAEGVGR